MGKIVFQIFEGPGAGQLQIEDESDLPNSELFSIGSVWGDLIVIARDDSPIPFPTPLKAWKRVAYCISTYGGAFAHSIYEELMRNPGMALNAIVRLQNTGSSFRHEDVWTWCFEICGSFETTHPRYVSPVANDAGAKIALCRKVWPAIGMKEYLKYLEG